MDQNYIINMVKKYKRKKICEWDPYTLPVIAETNGIVNYMDLVDGVSLQKLLMMLQVYQLNQ